MVEGLGVEPGIAGQLLGQQLRHLLARGGRDELVGLHQRVHHLLHDGRPLGDDVGARQQRGALHLAPHGLLRALDREHVDERVALALLHERGEERIQHHAGVDGVLLDG